MAKTTPPFRQVRKASLLIAFLLGVTLTSISQAQDFSWSIRLQNGDELPRVALLKINGDTLYFLNRSHVVDWTTVDSVSQLRRERRNAILPASLIGAVGGGAIGYALKPTARDQGEANVYSAVFGMVIGGVAGYFIGSILRPDQVIDVQHMDRRERIETLAKEIQER